MKILFAFLAFCSFIFAAVDLNKASKEELMSIKGVGEKKAEAIIEYREKTPFKSVEDLANVKGFGTKSVEKIKSELSVDEPQQ